MSFSFKKSELPVQDNVYAPIAPGVYEVQMEAVEEKATLSGGISWSFKMKIPATGRTFFLNYNVENANSITQEIARRDIAEIATLIGAGDDISLDTIKTNKRFSIVLEQRPVGDKVYYNAKKWALASPSQITAAPSTTTKKVSPPWEKK